MTRQRAGAEHVGVADDVSSRRGERGFAAVEHLGIIIVAAALLVVVIGAATPWGSSIATSICQRIEQISDSSLGCGSGSDQSAHENASDPRDEPPVCRFSSSTESRATDTGAGVRLWRVARVGGSVGDHAAYTVEQMSDGSYQVHLAEGINGELSAGVDLSYKSKNGGTNIGGQAEFARQVGAEVVQTWNLEDQAAFDAFMPSFEEHYAEVEDRGFIGSVWEGTKGAARATGDFLCFWCDDSPDDGWSHLTRAPDSTSYTGNSANEVSGSLGLSAKPGENAPFSLGVGSVEGSYGIDDSITIQTHETGEKAGQTTLSMAFESGGDWEGYLLGLTGGSFSTSTGAVHISYDNATGELTEVRLQTVNESGSVFALDASNLIGGIDIPGSSDGGSGLGHGEDGFGWQDSSYSAGFQARLDGEFDSSTLVTDVTLEVNDGNREVAQEWLGGVTGVLRADMLASALASGDGAELFWPGQASDDPVQQMLFEDATAHGAIYANTSESSTTGPNVDLILADFSRETTSTSSTGELVDAWFLGGEDPNNPGQRSQVTNEDCLSAGG